MAASRRAQHKSSPTNVRITASASGPACQPPAAAATPGAMTAPATQAAMLALLSHRLVKAAHAYLPKAPAAQLPLPATWHTVETVAGRYHRKPAVIRGWLRAGLLPGKRIAGRWMISDADLAAFEARF